MTHPISIQLSLEYPQPSYSIEDAVAIIHKIHLQLESVELYRIKLKWWMGCVLTHTERPAGSRCDVVEQVGERLWSEHRIRAGRSMLYQCMKLYQGLSGDYGRFEAWIETRRQALHRPVYWYDVVNDLLGGRSNPAVIGQEAADEQDYLDAERAVEAIERIIMRAASGNREAAGVLEAIRLNIMGLMLIGPASRETPRSTEYLQFVATFGCLACGRPSEPHHALGRRGTSVKPSDFGSVPLCREHHVALHQSGRAAFEAFYHISLAEVVASLIHCFITGTWLTVALQKIE